MSQFPRSPSSLDLSHRYPPPSNSTTPLPPQGTTQQCPASQQAVLEAERTARQRQSVGRGNGRWPGPGVDVCDGHAERYLNLPEVQRAIHVRPDTVPGVGGPCVHLSPGKVLFGICCDSGNGLLASWLCLP